MPRTQIEKDQAYDPDFLSPDEHTAIGEGAPHHARKHTIASTLDHDVSGAPTDGQTLVWSATESKWVPQDAAGGHSRGHSFHSALDHTDWLGSPAGGQVPQWDSVAARWKPVPVSTLKVVGIPLVFGSDVTPYFRVQAAAYAIAARFVFPGSLSAGAAPIGFSLLGYTDGAGVTGRVRVFDLTNVKVIGESATFAGVTPQVVLTTTLANIPTGQAIFEVQLARPGGGGVNKAYLNYFNLYWA